MDAMDAYNSFYGKSIATYVPTFFGYRISSYSCRGNYSFLNSSSEETIQVFISLM